VVVANAGRAGVRFAPRRADAPVRMSAASASS
jgi:hypothetical protein